MKLPTLVCTCHLAAYPETPDWESKHPKSWTSEDVVNWIYSYASDHKIDHEVRAEEFQAVTGKDLYSLKPEDYKKLHPTHYDVFYRAFSALSKRAQFDGPETLCPTTSPMLCRGADNIAMSDSLPISDDWPVNMDSLEGVALIGDHRYPFIPNDNFHDISGHHLPPPAAPARYQYLRKEAEPDDPGYSSAGESEKSIARLVPNLETSSHPQSPSVVRTESHMQIENQDDQRPQEKPKKVPGKRGRKLGQTTRGNHLWEFMRDMLHDPRHNPSVIEWKDVKEGVFRVVQSSTVAKMWGEKKKNTSMNYEKLSRAMRFCRDKQYFANVPRSGNYPKKLCFKFGEKAHGWQPTGNQPQMNIP